MGGRCKNGQGSVLPAGRTPCSEDNEGRGIDTQIHGVIRAFADEFELLGLANFPWAGRFYKCAFFEISTKILICQQRGINHTGSLGAESRFLASVPPI